MEFELNYEARVMIAYGQLPAPEAVKNYESFQLERKWFLDSLTTRYPDLYAIRMMNAFRSPLIPGAMTHKQRLDTLKSCFFDHAAIDDPLLLNAPVYTYKIIDYLSLFKADTLSLDQQEIQFCLAVDGIMTHVSDDPPLRSFVTDFLLEGFELLGMEKVQLYMAENYLDENCGSGVAEVVLSRMEGYRAMSKGATAPDFEIRDMHGSTHQLSRLGKPYVLVIFWSSTCEHCQDMLRQLSSWYQSKNLSDIEVVAISLDESKLDFERYTETLNPGWIHAHDPLSWEGKVAGDFFIYATPSLFLLDRERNILARPKSFGQFLQATRDLEH
jgi:thiol-disulfide isomerase/thioredoxin